MFYLCFIKLAVRYFQKIDLRFRVLFRYPNDGFAGLKVLLWISGLLLGLIVGRLVIHKWILCTKLKSRFFARDSQGAWIIMFLTSILSLYGFSLLYNVILDVCGGYILSYKCDNSFKIENKCLMKAIAAFIWIGNIITIWIIIDMMLQVRSFLGRYIYAFVVRIKCIRKYL